MSGAMTIDLTIEWSTPPSPPPEPEPSSDVPTIWISIKVSPGVPVAVSVNGEEVR